MNNTPITTDFARQVLHNLVKEKGPDITIEMVQRAVAKYFGIRVGDLTSKKRTQPVAFPGKSPCSCAAKWPMPRIL